jgi:peptidoglycan/xylan/chitin deacetylase (PgdA/CDA1 family)
MNRFAAALLLVLPLLTASVAARPAWGVEEHDRLAIAAGTPQNAVAITLDACAGAFDADLIQTLIGLRVPATVFVTKKWLDHNPAGTAVLLAHPELFELEDHGTAHVPAVIGRGRQVYGLAAEPDVAHLQAEVAGAAQAIRSLTGQPPHFFRGATAIYDAQSLETIRSMGYTVAGFSVNADAGATLPQLEIAARLRAVRPGDVVIAHMNKPAGATAEAFAATLPELLARGYRFITLSGAQLNRI